MWSSDHGNWIHYSRLSGMLINVYLGTLAIATAGYRLSPWHPLANFPGPRMACISKWWGISLLVISHGRPQKYQELHDRFGPWIRVGPNEISVNLKEAIRPVYLHLQRSQAYLGIPAASDTLITVVDRKRHAIRRRPWIKALSGQSLARHSSDSHNRAMQLVSILREETNTSRMPVDLGRWLSFLLMDTIGDMSFSGGFETMKARNDDSHLMEMLAKGASVVGVLNQIPWARSLVELVPEPGPIAKFYEFAKKKAREAKFAENDAASENILAEIITGSPSLSEEEAAADASLLIASSVETTSQALITLIRYIYAESRILIRLRQEITALPEDMNVDLNQLVYLNACIHEALRILPPFPVGPPRTTGALGTFIHDRFVPPNTTVHVPTWSLHHDDRNFKDASSFLPERWLPDSDIAPHYVGAYVPFSVGHGACPGRLMALQNTRIVIAHFVRSFDVVFPTDFDFKRFDSSYKEFGLWKHEALKVILQPACV